MKKQLIVLMALLMAASVSSVTYPYNYYDDFTTLNTSIWKNYAVSGFKYTLLNGNLVCNSSYGSTYEALEFLPDANFSHNTIIEYDIIYNDQYSAFHTINNQPKLVSVANRTFMQYSVYGNGLASNPNGQLYVVEYFAGTTPLDTTIVNPNGTEGNFRFETTKNSNGTYHYKIYHDGILKLDTDGVKNYSSLNYPIRPDELYFFCGNNGNNDWIIDNINITVFGEEAPPTNFAPILSGISPANNTLTNENLSVQFTLTDVDVDNLSCSLYVNGALDQTNSSIGNNTLTTFQKNWDEGSNQWYLNCTDEKAVVLSGIYGLYFDDHDPNIVSGLPTILNTTQYTNDTMRFFGNITNLNLTKVVRTIYYPNTIIYYQNTTTIFANSTFIDWDETFNTTDEPNGVWTYDIYAEDVVQNHTHYYSFSVNNCVPDWGCDGYGACNSSDLAPCNSIVDNNACGLPYSGDYSEFSAQPCNYCSYSLTLVNTTACVDGTEQVLYVDSNFLACCDLTGLPSDCAFGNQSSGVVNQSCSAFTGQYVTGDITAVVTDGIVAFGIGIVSLMGIIGLVFLFKWGRKQVKVK